MFKPEAYERKTFVVEAVQVTLENFTQVVQWCGGTLRKDDLNRPYISVDVRRPANVKQTMAYEGDWVLKAGTGFRIYTDHAFWKSFERTTKPVGPDPYQTGNVFERDGVQRRVVEDAMPGEPKEQTEEVVVEQSTAIPSSQLFIADTREPLVNPGVPAGYGGKQFRTPQELREEKQVPATWPPTEKLSRELHDAWVRSQGHNPVENPDSPHA